ncbi:VWA domain-containing protein [Deinococcus sp.]|uniref:VWA domain-containing protein n=1 Tax=Deinococcus sp. TaxID=47478 RepID=UPI0025C31850|nr:VWA domain-containing protein [Deinococcus sp.]
MAHQPQLLLALSLLAVSPEIGGLLIRGDRGAAKSTAARGLGALLPGGEFVNLPLGATEDRVLGTLDLDAALRGEVRLKPGLMAQAHGGLLYIDEVNLLPDHLVDVLLDAAAMGVVRVQRDGLSAEAPARFALIGSMNPEEGQLRPQFLDRFGLCADVLAPLDPVQRAEIMRRRISFETDAATFAAQWQGAQEQLREQLRTGRTLAAQVHLPGEFLTRIAELTGAAGVRSLRADLVLHRAARAYAALEGRLQVQWSDVEAVAPLVLNHRRDPRQSPPPPQSSPPQSPLAPPPEDEPALAGPPSREEVFVPTAAAPLDLRPGSTGTHAADRQGARLTRTVADPDPERLHLPSTLRAALERSGTGEFSVTRTDFQTPVYEQRGGRRVLFVADSSGSVGAAGRMGAVKAAMLDVLERGSGGRDRVALIVFRGTGATLNLDWTDDRQAAEEAVRLVPTGGRTPLAHALELAAEVLRGQRGAELVLFTDGRANVPLSAGSDAWADALTSAASLQGVSCTVVDTETGHVRLGRAAQLARVLGGSVTTL